MIIVITGEIGSGKTTLAEKLSLAAIHKNCSVGGILAIKQITNNPNLSEYYAHCLLTARQKLFATTRPTSNSVKLSRFFFPRSAIIFAARCLRNSAHCNFVFIDELGPIELQRKGLWRATNFLLQSSNANLVLVIRRSLMDKILAALNLKPAIVIDTALITQNSSNSAIDKIFDAL